MSEKRILILCRRDDRPDYDRRENMLSGLSTQPGAVYSGADYEDLVFEYDGQKLSVTDSVTGVDIADFDAIFLIGWFKSKTLDDVARAVAHYAKAHNVPFSNSEAYDGRSFTKLSQCVMAALNGVRMTPFLFCMDQRTLVRKVRETAVPYPYIAKAVSASRGRDNYLITNHDLLAELIEEEKEPPRFFIIQQFIPNDGDYRILVAGGRVRMVIHRQAQPGGYLNNTSQGGKATTVDVESLPESVIQDSLLLSKLFKREISGVDMVQHSETGEYYFLEINNMPQLATGSSIPAKLEMLNEYLIELASPDSK